ncbi:hypothetical protein IAT38_003290 [Cryptococcus sp. DSM 104549]
MASPGYAYSAQQQQQQAQPGKMVGGNCQAGVYAHHVPLHQQHAHAPVHVQQQQPQLPHQHQHQHQPGVVAGQAVGGVGVGVGGCDMAMDGSSQGTQVQGQGFYGGMYPQGQAVGAGAGSPRMQQPPGYGRQHGAGAVGQQGRGVGARKW